MSIQIIRSLIKEIILLESTSITNFPPNRLKHLSGLAAEAKKAGSFDEFRRDYIINIKHGQYWHLTDNPNFFIDLNQGPRDMSSMSNNSTTAKGDIMFTSDLDHWANYYKDRKYAALLDLSNVPREAYQQISRGFGNEFYLSNATTSGIKLIKVISISTAKRIAKKYDKIKPQSYDELYEFYTIVTSSI
jgi:hypothetical protein